MARDPTTVWMVHKQTGLQGVRGELILEDRRLIFRPEIRGAKPDLLGETVFPLDEVKSAGHALGSPVLELRVKVEGLPPVILFYFSKPPDIYSSPLGNPRTHGAQYLTTSNIVYGEEIAGWVEAIDEARTRFG